jgi:hypothetical protein
VRVTGRYRAPAEDGGLLIEPPPDRVGELLATNRARLNTSSVRIAGIPLIEFRSRAVDEITNAARQYLGEAGAIPAGMGLFVAGHQPEFFHPGVWVKNFVLNGYAKRNAEIPLNLIVDNDSLHPPVVRVPGPADAPEHVHAVAVEYDRLGRDLPYEEYRIADRTIFDSFPERLRVAIRGWKFEPIAFATWPKLQAELDRGVSFAEAVSRVRRGIERDWGVTNLELPVGKLAETRAFGQFVRAIIDDLPRFVDCYNTAIRSYRVANHVRSENHPAPELVVRGGVLEAPFWAWRSGSARRERVFVRNGTLLAGDMPIASSGWKLRPRALTLTLFVRLCVADLFVHGIGGAKYDEVTDEIMRRFFNLEPPAYLVATATLRLPLPRFLASAADLQSAERHLRDLEWNPQRFEATQKRFPNLVTDKTRLIESEPATTPERRAWFRRLQEITREMRPAVAAELDRARQSLEHVHAELAANAVLANREYAWLLFPAEMLQSFFARVR